MDLFDKLGKLNRELYSPNFMTTFSNASLNRVVPCNLNLFYDHSGDTDSSFFSVADSGADGKKVALQINAGHAGIGDGLEVVKLKTNRVGAVVGNYTIEHLASDDTVKNSFTEAASALPTGSSIVTKTMTSGCKTIVAGDRIAIGYTGTAAGTSFLTVRTAAGTQPTNTKNQGFNGSTWSDLSSSITSMWSVDGT